MTTSEHADLIAEGQHWSRPPAPPKGEVVDAGLFYDLVSRLTAALAPTPSPAQPTEANEQTLRVVAEIRSRLEAPGYADADRVRTALLHVEAVESGKARTLAPSPVQGADDAERVQLRETADEWAAKNYLVTSALVAAEAVIAEASTYPHNIRCSALGTGSTELCNCVQSILATYQQSPQAALNEVRAEAWDEGQGEGTVAAINFTPLPPNPYRARPAELRAQSGAAV